MHLSVESTRLADAIADERGGYRVGLQFPAGVQLGEADVVAECDGRIAHATVDFAVSTANPSFSTAMVANCVLLLILAIVLLFSVRPDDRVAHPSASNGIVRAVRYLP